MINNWCKSTVQSNCDCSDEFKRCSDQLAHMEKDLKKFKNVCSDVFASIEKVMQTVFILLTISVS